jgi:transposase-like protein
MERKERRHHTREFKLEAVRLAAVGAFIHSDLTCPG